MNITIKLRFVILCYALISILMNTNCVRSTYDLPDGTKDRPLRVMLIPADGGTEQGTLADYQPIFNAITKTEGIYFDLKVGQSYNAVVEGMVADKVDIAFFGPVTYYQAKQKGAAELLAVAVEKGQSIYHSAIFVSTNSLIANTGDLKGKSVAFGDVNSTSSFMVPITMMINAGIDPAKDLGRIYITGSHANSLAALEAGKVDAACASLDSYEKSVKSNGSNPTKIKILAKSDPIPYPPLAMNVRLNLETKNKLKNVFNHIHENQEIQPEMIRGYAGKKVDRYNANFPEAEFDKVMAKLARVNNDLIGEILKKASASK